MPSPVQLPHPPASACSAVLRYGSVQVVVVAQGIENSAVTLGELELPPTARLKIHRVNTTLNNGELVTLAAAPAGISGALVGTKFDANGHSDGFLEACMRFYPTGADAAKNSTPIFLSSGAEVRDRHMPQ
jgi:hypothetical protein